MTTPTPDAICERLRDADRNSVQRCLGSRIFAEAADLIQQQQATIERLSAALEIIKEPRVGPELEWTDKQRGNYWLKVALEYRSIARAALGKDANDG